MLTRAQYISQYRDEAIRSTRGTGLFPSVTLAQAILESNNGNSLLASKYNNHFGVKAGSNYRGKRVNLVTQEVYSGKSVTIQDDFRVYNHPVNSFRDRNQLLASNPRYANVFRATTPEQQATELKKAGYATDPDYVAKLVQIINQHGLKALDHPFYLPVGLMITSVLAIAAGGYLWYETAGRFRRYWKKTDKK